MEAGTRFLTAHDTGKGPALSYRAYVPRVDRRVPTLVLIHGGHGDAGRMFRSFLPRAMALDMPLVAPDFPLASFRGYQRLNGRDGPLSAARALASTLTDAADVLGMDTRRVALCGFSGGAQFAHRYALYAPGLVRRLVVASSGYYTYLDESRPFPAGIHPNVLSAGKRPDVAAFLRLPLHVLAGEFDVDSTAKPASRDASGHAQGANRLTRALRWVDHLEAMSSERHRVSHVTFDVLPGTGHSFTSAIHRGDLVSRVLDFINPTAAGPRADDARRGQ